MRKISITVLERPAFMAMIIFIYIYNYQTSGFGNTVTNLLILLFIGIEFLVVIGHKGRMVYNNSVNSYIFFLLSCMISVTYSFAQKDSLAKIKTIFILLLFLFALTEFLRNTENIFFMLRAVALSAIIAGIYLLVKSDWATGSRMTGVIGDSNQVGAYLAYSLTVLMYCHKRKLIPAFICFPATILMLSVSILSGSRSSTVITLFSIGAFVILTVKKNKFKPLKLLSLFIFGILILLIIFHLIMTNELLYKIIGSRFVSFFEIMSGGNSSINENSIIERTLMRDLAFQKFTESVGTFFGGNGIGYFSAYYLSLGGRYCFCHNNYVELLSGVGIIGTVFYYFPYISSGYYALKNYSSIYKYEAITVIILLIQISLMHWFVVFYYQKLEFIFISIIICFGKILKNENSVRRQANECVQYSKKSN